MTVSLDSDAVIANPLRASGLLDGAALEQGRAFQREHGGLLSEALLHLNLVREGDFLRIFAEFYNTKFVKAEKLKTLKLDPELIDKIGARTAERLRMCPIRWDDERGELHLVAAVPLASTAEPEARQIFGARTVSIYVATAGSVNALIRRGFYREMDAFEQVTANGAGPLLAKPKEPAPDEVKDGETQAGQSVRTQLVDTADASTLANLRKENMRLRIAQEFNMRVTQERTVETMIDRVLSVVFDLLPAEGAAIVMTGATPITRARKDGKTVEVPTSVIESTLVSPAGVLVNNALVDDRFGRSESVVMRGVQSVMAVPLRARGRTLGILYVDSISQTAAFTEEDLPLLESIGNQAAIMLDNAELIARVQREVESRTSLERFLSPAEADAVLKGKGRLHADGQKGEVTALFADVRGFTRIADELEPHEIVTFLNRFFSAMVEVVKQHGGTVDKFIGDCVMVLWGVTDPRPTDPRQALACALAMVNKARTFKLQNRPVDLCVGVNTGEAVLGAIGSDRRLDYTAIGGSINLAARLCSIAKAGEVLITTDTVMRAGSGVYADPVDPVFLKGMDGPLTPFLLKGLAPSVNDPVPLSSVVGTDTLPAVPAMRGPKTGR